MVRIIFVIEGKGTLNSKNKVRIDEYLTSANNIKVKSKIVFVEAFKYIIIQVKSWLKKNDPTLISNFKNEIQWIVSIPAIWSVQSKDLMLKWLNESGISNKYKKNQIILQYEPDCASISVRHEFNEKNEVIRIGSKYILLDLGGGTADFACHEIHSEYEVSEIYHPSGGAWGGNYVDKEFVKLLNEIFGKNIISQFKTINNEKYMELLKSFRKSCKKTFFNNNFKNGILKPKVKRSFNHGIELPNDFVEYLENNENLNIDDLDDHFDDFQFRGKKGLISYSGQFLQINSKIWESVFDVCVNPIMSHLDDLLNNRVSNIQYIILAGGFSESRYVQYKIITNFGIKSKYKLKIIIPRRPLLSVVDGAARLGLKPLYVSARKLSETYGADCSYPIDQAKNIGLSQEYIKKHSCKTFDNRVLVHGCFNVYASRNETINLGEKRSDCYVKSNTDSEYVRLYSSKERNPNKIEQGQLIGEILIPNTIKQGENFYLDFYFGLTVIKVEVRTIDNNFIQQTNIKFNFYQ